MFGVDPSSRSSEMGVVRFIGVTPGNVLPKQENCAFKDKRES